MTPRPARAGVEARYGPVPDVSLTGPNGWPRSTPTRQLRGALEKGMSGSRTTAASSMPWERPPDPRHGAATR